MRLGLVVAMLVQSTSALDAAAPLTATNILLRRACRSSSQSVDRPTLGSPTTAKTAFAALRVR